MTPLSVRLAKQEDLLPETMPRYHFTSPTGIDCDPFDPNGAIYWKGRYHLGYIHGNYNECRKHFWWGHASSTDLIHWRCHPPMLSPNPGDPDDGIFSGNAFVDKLGRVVLHYHGVNAGNCIAINEDDDLIHFRKLRANPVMKDPVWDPYGWLEGDTYYSISGSLPVGTRSASLYKCTNDDHTEWHLLGDLLSHDLPTVKVIGLSVDPVDSHAGWAADIEETQGHAPNRPRWCTSRRPFDTYMITLPRVVRSGVNPNEREVPWRLPHMAVATGAERLERLKDDLAPRRRPRGHNRRMGQALHRPSGPRRAAARAVSLGRTRRRPSSLGS
jgi:hypothetical protein